MGKSFTFTITEEEFAELEVLLDAYLAEVRKEKGESDTDAPQRSKDDRTRLEALLDELTDQVSRLSDENRSLTERVLRLELQLQHQKEQSAAEGENFRLQLENLMLRLQHSLPPDEQSD